MQWEPLRESHVDATLKRAARANAILALHDSTLCQFGGDTVRTGAFRTAKSKSGFIAHTCLGVSAYGAREPNGLLGMIPVVRLPDEKEAAASPATVYANESHRWIDLVAKVHDRVGPEKHTIHVMDSEGDCVDLLWHMWASRLSQPGSVLSEPSALSNSQPSAADQAPSRCRS